MKTKFRRRTFLKQGAVLGGGLMLLGPKAQLSRAAGGETNPGGGPMLSANETIKTIRSLRTIHGNFLDQPLPEAALQTILKASVRAANASNQGSCMLLYCVDFNRNFMVGGHF